MLYTPSTYGPFATGLVALNLMARIYTKYIPLQPYGPFTHRVCVA